MKYLIDFFKKNGWNFKPNENPNPVDKNFPLLMPSSIKEFSVLFDVLESPSENAWFFSHLDYLDLSDSAFKWNEFKTNGLESSVDLNQKKLVCEFWGRYFPFAMSVKDDYKYLAIGVANENQGKIYMGENSEEDEVSLISDDIESFFEILNNHYENKKSNLLDTFF